MAEQIGIRAEGQRLKKISFYEGASVLNSKLRQTFPCSFDDMLKVKSSVGQTGQKRPGRIAIKASEGEMRLTILAVRNRRQAAFIAPLSTFGSKSIWLPRMDSNHE
jgi:hypothetical protein